MPLFAKQVGIKMACNAAREVQQNFLECQGRKVSTSFLQNLSHKVAGIAEQQETQWQYDLPSFPQPITAIAISLDGNCMHKSKKAGRKPWGQGTGQFLDAKDSVQIGLNAPQKRCNSADYLAVMDAFELRFEEVSYPVHSYSELSLEAWQYKSLSKEASSAEIDSLPEYQEDEDGVQEGGWLACVTNRAV
jgi:hypothetical protein